METKASAPKSRLRHHLKNPVQKAEAITFGVEKSILVHFDVQNTAFAYISTHPRTHTAYTHVPGLQTYSRPIGPEIQKTEYHQSSNVRIKIIERNDIQRSELML